MDAASTLQARQRYERLSGYLAADPGNLSLLEDTVDSALLCGMKSEALSLLDRALALQSNSPSLQFKKGTALLAMSQYAEALAAFQSLVDAGNYHPAITYNLAYAFYCLGQPAEAIRHLDTVVAASLKELPQFDLLYARGLYQLQDYQRSLERIDQYLVSKPEDAEGLGLKAMLLYDTDQNEAAAEIAGKLLAKRDDDLMAHMVLGSIALENRDAPNAKSHFQMVVERDSSSGRAWSGLAFSALLETRIDEAEQDFEAAVRHMPNHLGTWHGLAWTRVLKRDFVGAHAAVDAAMQLDRTFSENHGTLAVVLVLEGKPAEAEAAAKRGMRLNPRSAASHFARSLLMAQAGDAASSQRLVNKILSGAGLDSQTGIAETILGLAGFGSSTRGPIR